MLTLEVKNFGPLKDINIELNKTNLFIGENGSGKSVLAKLITIVTSLNKYSENLIEEFEKLDINFITEKTYIKYTDSSDEHILFTIDKKEVKFSEEVLETISNLKKSKEILSSFTNPNNIPIDGLLSKRWISQYIPADRNLISIFNKSIYNLFASDIPLPKHILNFGAQYEKAKNEINNLDVLGMTFRFENGQDKIYYDEDNFLPLENSSSGIQTALPLYLTVKYFNKKHNDIIIEEPEQNLYPKAQADTTKFIIENSSENIYLMTHSPYILSTLNILLFAYKASNKNDILKEKISKFIPVFQQINPDEFSAYFIRDGVSESIKGKSTGLISENAIDEVGDIIDDEFNQLMEIYREFKND